MNQHQLRQLNSFPGVMNDIHLSRITSSTKLSFFNLLRNQFTIFQRNKETKTGEGTGEEEEEKRKKPVDLIDFRFVFTLSKK